MCKLGVKIKNPITAKTRVILFVNNYLVLKNNIHVLGYKYMIKQFKRLSFLTFRKEEYTKCQ